MDSTALHCTTLYSNVLHCTALHSALCALLPCTVLYWTLFHCAAKTWKMPIHLHKQIILKKVTKHHIIQIIQFLLESLPSFLFGIQK